MSSFFQRFTLYELVVTAIMAAIGIAIKPVVVPLAHIVCGPLMIPSGALAGGLYMMWLVVGYGMVKKPGSALIISVIQALLVIFTGIVGSHGIMSLLTYVLPGLAVELVMIISRHRACCPGYCVAAGMLSNMVGTAAVNIIFFQAPGAYLIFILTLSAISGLAGGVLAWQLLKVFEGFTANRESKRASHKWMDDIDNLELDADDDVSSEQEASCKINKRIDRKTSVRSAGSKKNWKWIFVVALVLAAIAGVAGWMNHSSGSDDGEGISVLVNGEPKASFTMSEIMKMEKQTEYVNLSSGSKEDAVGDFTGTLLGTILDEAGVSADGYSAVLLTAGDGYSSAADPDEIDEVLIAYELDGEPLGDYSKGGTGPLRALFFKDTYGNRSVMNLTKIDLR